MRGDGELCLQHTAGGQSVGRSCCSALPGGIRDHCVYKGHRVFLYERAQIFVADVWGAFKGVDLGEFKDIASITIFADHVVPAILQHWVTLTCNPTLDTVLDTSQEITPGSEEEVEIRTCSITAVEWLWEYLTAQFGKQVLSVHVDWWLGDQDCQMHQRRCSRGGCWEEFLRMDT